MEDLVDRGLVRLHLVFLAAHSEQLFQVRSIGLSNFNASQIDRIQKIARIKPTVLQVPSLMDGIFCVLIVL